MSASVSCMPRDLERLIVTLLADERVPRWVIEPALLARTLHVEGWCASEILSAAESELVRLHRTELAFLLREAANSRMHGGPPTTTWRTCFREALRSAALDGLRVSPELYRLLLDCRSADLERWPDAVALARAALALHDVEDGRARLAETLLAAGRARDAGAFFAAAFRRARSFDHRDRALAGLLAAHASASPEEDWN